MKQRAGVAVLGVFVIGVYSALMAVQALVLDPRAAVPGQTLTQIHTQLTQSGMNVQGGVVSVTATATLGVALAVAAAVVGIRRQLSLVIMSVLFLALLALGAVATFSSSFALGMDVADVYGVSGAPHTPWAGVLYLTSLSALLALIAIGVNNKRQMDRVDLPRTGVPNVGPADR